MAETRVWGGIAAGQRFAARIASTMRTVSTETRVTRASRSITFSL